LDFNDFHLFKLRVDYFFKSNSSLKSIYFNQTKILGLFISKDCLKRIIEKISA